VTCDRLKCDNQDTVPFKNEHKSGIIIHHRCQWMNNQKHKSMDGLCVDRTFFSLGSLSPANLPIAESSRSVPRVQKLGFIKWMVSKRKTRGGLFAGAGSHWSGGRAKDH
jgi:hypothetical protein